MCGNDNYCEIVCQLFQASLLLMDLAVVGNGDRFNSYIGDGIGVRRGVLQLPTDCCFNLSEQRGEASPNILNFTLITME